jgi:hypothetical protein
MGGDEARVLFTISDPKYQADIDNGTINQVSVGMQPAALNCSVCGFDYLGADATMNNLWGLTCNDGHTIGDAATYAVIDGMSSFFELSLVGKAAVIGARIVGPSESRLQGNTQFRLAASARPEGVTGLILTATPKENTLDLTALTAALTAATVDKANAQTQLTAAQTEVTDLKAKIATLEAAAGRIPDLEAAAGHVDAAAAALRTEATTILTACGKQDQVANLAGKNIPGLLEVITAHRAEFAAAVPIGPKSTPAMTKSDTPVGPSHTAAFSARR